MCGLEMMALTDKQQENVQVCENNWIRIMGEKKADTRRMGKLRVEVGVKESFQKKLVSNMVKSAGYEERKGGENWQREQMPRKWKEKGGEEDQECDERIALREIWKEWEENG